MVPDAPLPAATPVPRREIVCVLGVALSEITRVAPCGLSDVGSKITLIVQLVEAAT
jgi:hypothetical protein